MILFNTNTANTKHSKKYKLALYPSAKIDSNILMNTNSTTNHNHNHHHHHHYAKVMYAIASKDTYHTMGRTRQSVSSQHSIRQQRQRSNTSDRTKLMGKSGSVSSVMRCCNSWSFYTVNIAFLLLPTDCQLIDVGWIYTGEVQQ